MWFLGSGVQAWYLWGTGLTALCHVESSLTRDQMCVSCMGGQVLTTEPQGSSREFFLVEKSAWGFPSPTFPVSLGWTHHLLCLYGYLRRTQTWAACWLLPRCHWRLRNPAEWRCSAEPSLQAPSWGWMARRAGCPETEDSSSDSASRAPLSPRVCLGPLKTPLGDL